MPSKSSHKYNYPDEFLTKKRTLKKNLSKKKTYRMETNT